MNNRARPRDKGDSTHLRIHSVEDFAAVLHDAITDRSRFTSASAAARQAGVAQATLWRLCRSPGQDIRADVYAAVRGLLTREEQIVLDEKVWPSDAVLAYDEYTEWLLDQQAEEAWADDLVRLLVERVRIEVPHVYNEWGTLFAAGDFHESRRILALVRVVAPLTESRASGGVERGQSELTRAEFGRFVELGWQREKILLRRKPDHLRAHGQG